jgi:hypothetical protein
MIAHALSSGSPPYSAPPFARRACRAVLALVVLAACALAQDTSDQRPLAERVQRFRRNQGLIKNLVQSGLRIAAAEDPLDRAEQCKSVVQLLVDEISSTADGDDDDREFRITEMGEHLQLFVKKGLVEKLREARNSIPIGSAKEKELHLARDNTRQMTESLQPRLQKVKGSAKMLQDLERLQKEMERATQGKD